jgi:hypothetical protein
MSARAFSEKKAVAIESSRLPPVILSMPSWSVLPFRLSIILDIANSATSVERQIKEETLTQSGSVVYRVGRGISCGA